MTNWRPTILGQVRSPLEYATPAMPAWFARALCREVDPALFYPEMGHNEQAKAAKAVCRQCPVRATCLEFALSQPAAQDYGVWGATVERERRELRKQRREEAAS